MTGVPTLLTNVGEISEYVQDGINAYLVAPENPQLYANKISYILDNYLEALKVAEVARNYIINKFSMLSAGKRIIDYLNDTQF